MQETAVFQGYTEFEKELSCIQPPRSNWLIYRLFYGDVRTA